MFLILSPVIDLKLVPTLKNLRQSEQKRRTSGQERFLRRGFPGVCENYHPRVRFSQSAVNSSVCSRPRAAGVSRRPVPTLSSGARPRVHVRLGPPCALASPRERGAAGAPQTRAGRQRSLRLRPPCGPLQGHFFAFAGSCSLRWPHRPRSQEPRAGPRVWCLNSALSSHVPALPPTSNIFR